MAVVEHGLDTHDDHHHDHGEFIAHHFDEGAEQQYDAGKLGIWVFLVTEVLFFGGLFVAYTLYRTYHPEIFEQAHVFLDKYLGFANTVVLLFSSWTMAMAVRYAQLGKNRVVTWYVLATMVCAAMFIGVKAIEYSHKWDMGILVRSAFNYNPGHHAAPEGTLAHALGVSPYLIYLSVVPTLLLVGFLIASAIAKMTDKPKGALFFLCMSIAMGGYFLGVVAAQFYMEVTDGGLGGHASRNVVLYAQEHDDTGEQDSAHPSEHAADQPHAGAQVPGGAEEHATGEHAGGENTGDEHAGGELHGPQEAPDFDRDIGIFFSIYYCMTGLHAIHIIAGIGFLSWILWRSILGHWRPDYFGPVDYVGLYWHLVDLIWIYLFPLLYLID